VSNPPPKAAILTKKLLLLTTTLQRRENQIEIEQVANNKRGQVLYEGVMGLEKKKKKGSTNLMSGSSSCKLEF